MVFEITPEIATCGRTGAPRTPYEPGEPGTRCCRVAGCCAAGRCGTIATWRYRGARVAGPVNRGRIAVVVLVLVLIPLVAVLPALLTLAMLAAALGALIAWGDNPVRRGTPPDQARHRARPLSGQADPVFRARPNQAASS